MGEAKPAQFSLSSSRGRWVMLAVILASSIVFLDTTVVNLALKSIGHELASRNFGTLEAQSYVVNGYFITLSASLILAGALTDFYGRRRMFLLGFTGFGITSLLCGVAPTIEFLIVARVLQGAAGAMLVPGSLSIITSSFSGEDQGRAFGIWAGAGAAASIFGPFLGGVLVNLVSWRAAFLINLPFLLIAAYATMRHVPESRDESATGRFDWLGAAVVGLAVAGLSFGTVRGQQRQWQDPAALLALGVGAAMTIAFPVLMLKRKNPLVPLDLFKSRNFTYANLATFLIYGALYVNLSFLSLFMIGVLGYNEPAAGLAFIPGSLFLAVFSSRFGKFASRHGPRWFMTVGPMIMAAGLVLMSMIPSDSEPWRLGSGGSTLPPSDYLAHLLPSLVVFGIGLTVMVAPLTTAVMTSVATERSGLASAINNAISRVGAPLIGALIFVTVASSFYSSIQKRVPTALVDNAEFRNEVSPLNPPPEDADTAVKQASKEASTEAFRFAMLVAAGLLVLGSVAAGFGIRNLNGSDG